MERRPPRIFLTAAALAVLVLAAGVYVERGRLVEAWHILRLRSAAEATRLDAAEKLAAMRSVAAVSHLIRAVGEEDREEVTFWIGSGWTYACGPQGCTSIPAKSSKGVHLTPVAHALFSIGPEALPALRAAIREEWARIEREEHPSETLRLVSTLAVISDAIEGKEGEVEKSSY